MELPTLLYLFTFDRPFPIYTTPNNHTTQPIKTTYTVYSYNRHQLTPPHCLSMAQHGTYPLCGTLCVASTQGCIVANYYHPPYSHSDEEQEHVVDFCGYLCYVVWAHERSIFCDKNRSCCLVSGESWVRFDALNDHISYKGLSVCGDTIMCTKTYLPRVAYVFNEYR